MTGLALLAVLGSRHVSVMSQGLGRRIPIVATRFSFSPNEIRIAEGESVTLVLSATDFAHGFSIPDLNTRIDTVPGKAVELTLPALRAGRYACLCDNFCGEGHDEMAAVLWVSPSAAGG
jgi:cytochrome c oxidase subunit 2